MIVPGRGISLDGQRRVSCRWACFVGCSDGDNHVTSRNFLTAAIVPPNENDPVLDSLNPSTDFEFPPCFLSCLIGVGENPPAATDVLGAQRQAEFLELLVNNRRFDRHEISPGGIEHGGGSLYFQGFEFAAYASRQTDLERIDGAAFLAPYHRGVDGSRFERRGFGFKGDGYEIIKIVRGFDIRR
jgi:hypothetical protein